LYEIFSLNDVVFAEGVTKRWNEGESAAVSFTSDAGWMSVMNTWMGLLVFLSLADVETSGDRFGPHLVENFIGLIRRLCHDYYSNDNILRTTAKAHIVAAFMAELEIPVHHNGRENCAGVVFTIPTYRNVFNPPFEPNIFSDELLSYAGVTACRVDPPNGDPSETERALLQRLEMLLQLSEVEIAARTPRKRTQFKNKSANSQILSRIIQSSSAVHDE
jgi:hypothetical protein